MQILESNCKMKQFPLQNSWLFQPFYYPAFPMTPIQVEQSLIAFKKVAVNEPNNHWQMDITYVTLFPKIIFVLGIIDTYTLEIIGYKAGFSITSQDVIKTVLKSMNSRDIKGNLTIRTDNGPQ